MKLLVFTHDGEKVWRTFNLRFVRHFDEESCRLMLQGAKTPVVVDRGSMARLIQAATLDTERMSLRMEYLRGKAEAAGRSSGCGRLPWWKRIFGK